MALEPKKETHIQYSRGKVTQDFFPGSTLKPGFSIVRRKSEEDLVKITKASISSHHYYMQ